MKKLIIVFLILEFIVGCQKTDTKSKTTIEDVCFEDIVDDVPPPESSQSIYMGKSVQDWLSKICNGEAPKKSVTEYNFKLFESTNNYIISIAGVEKSENHQSSLSTIVFKPNNMFFQLPMKEYDKVNPDEVVKKLTSQIKDFTKTEKFKNSFLTKAECITSSFSGELWRR